MNIFYGFLVSIFFGCNGPTDNANTFPVQPAHQPIGSKAYDTTTQTIHVLVALCDNKYQGIVPVQAKIGNGQDVDNNLYWGCAYGVRTYFKNSKNWKLLKRFAIDSIKMERLVFKNTSNNYYLVADAYNGKNIEECTVDFFKSAAGLLNDTIQIANTSIGINGNAKLISYIGHNGLMDFKLKEKFVNNENDPKDVIILACASKPYFAEPLVDTKANPILWSTNLMSPEAYTLYDALESYMKNEGPEEIRNAAASAYSKYQKCSIKAARNLLVCGK